MRTISLTFDNGPEPGDLPTGAMAQLPAFLDRAMDAGARFTCEFPPSCVVVEHGVPQDALDEYVRAT